MKKNDNRGKGYRQAAVVGGHDIELSTQENSEGKIVGVRIFMPRATEFEQSILSALSTAISMGLDRGIDLEEFVEEYTWARFSPSGPVVGNPSIQNASSVLDYAFKELAIVYLGRVDLEDMPNSSLRDRTDEGVEAEPYSRLKEREKASVSCELLSQSLRAYLEESVQDKPNDAVSLQRWEEMRGEIDNLIEQLEILKVDLLRSEVRDRQKITERSNKIGYKIGILFEKYSDLIDRSLKMSLAAGVLALLNWSGATMSVATPIIMAIFGGSDVIDLLKGGRSSGKDKKLDPDLP